LISLQLRFLFIDAGFLFECVRRAEQGGFIKRARHELHADRQAA